MGKAWKLVLAAAVVAAGCGDDDGSPMADAAVAMDGGGDAGPTCTEWSSVATELNRWPEPRLLVEDAASPTGQRLDTASFPHTDFTRRLLDFSRVFTEDAHGLNGFSANGASLFRFSAEVDPDALPEPSATVQANTPAGMILLGEDDGASTLLETEFTSVEDVLSITPLAPMPETRWAVAFVTDRIAPAVGGCVQPSTELQGLLELPRNQRAIEALTELSVIESADELVALSVFPVREITGDSRAIAADIADRDFVLEGPPECEEAPEGQTFRECTAYFEAFDYRDADRLLRRDPDAEVEPVSTHRLTMSIWLPLEGEGPWPTVVWSSGLGSGRLQGRELATFAAPEGFATVAIDAVSHGDHPDVGEQPDSVAATALRFFGFTQMDRTMAPELLRDHFRQSTYDKLQLFRLLAGGISVDEDPEPELLTERLVYLGVSLGGVMAVEPLSLSSDISAAVLVVPGGRMSAIMDDSELFAPLINVVSGLREVDRLFFNAAVQAVVDPGDAVNYAPHLQQDRFAGPAPSVLAGVALDDEIVPNSASWALMRALGLPLVGDELRPVAGLTERAMAPVSGNCGETCTSGYLQFDVVFRGGEVRDATHSSVPASATGVEAWLHFLRSHVDTGVAEIIDPYVTTGLDHE